MTVGRLAAHIILMVLLGALVAVSILAGAWLVLVSLSSLVMINFWLIRAP